MSEVCTIEASEPGCANLTGALTFKSTPGLYHKIEKLFNASNPVSSIDLSGVTSVDSAGLALLLEWQATQRPVPRDLQIINAPSALMSLAQLCDAVELLNISGRSHES
jgi:phospholipid transport system transporter-binding protein